MAPEVKFGNEQGSEVTVNCFGATVTSWKHNGQEMLFCSKNAVFDDKKAIRGGIPVVFPNFGPWELGPQHGFARIKEWKLSQAPTKGADGSVSACLTLEDDDQTRTMWNKRFRLVYTVSLHDSSLQTALSVTNTGSELFDFTTLLHTYFRVPDITQTTLQGLSGCNYVDKVHGGDHTENRTSITLDENYDRVYRDCVSPVELKPDNKGTLTIRMDRTNLPDIVVWNPWADKAKGMSDFGDEEYREMVWGA